MVVVKLTDIMSGSITFENILSIRVLEWLVTGLPKLAPHTQKFGLVIRTYVPIGHAGKSGT